MDLFTDEHRDRPALEMAFSGALLELVAARDLAGAVRVLRPGPTVAFGRTDRLRPGFEAACEASRRHERVPVLRLAGGRAAAYDGDCLIVEVIRRHEGLAGVDERFEDVVEFLRDSIRSLLHIDVEVGETEGEYCPGRYSLHLPGGGPKIAGVAQRVVRGAALTSAVLVVGGGDALRATIADVYGALELSIDPMAAGALSDHDPAISVEQVRREVLKRASERYGTTACTAGAELLARARALAGTFSL